MLSKKFYNITGIVTILLSIYFIVIVPSFVFIIPLLLGIGFVLLSPLRLNKFTNSSIIAWIIALSLMAVFYIVSFLIEKFGSGDTGSQIFGLLFIFGGIIGVSVLLSIIFFFVGLLSKPSENTANV